MSVGDFGAARPALAPAFFARGLRGFSLPNGRGTARRSTQPVRLCTDRCRPVAPLGAPSGVLSASGRAFAGNRPVVSELLAGVRSTPGRSPDAARVRGLLATPE